MSRWDKKIIICVAILLLWGLAAIYSASVQKQLSTGKNFVFSQLSRIAVGTGLCIVVVRLGYQFFISNAYFIYGAQLLLLAAVLLCGDTVFGAQRWIRLGGVTIQPSEFAKLSTVIMLSRILSDRPSRLREWRGLLWPVIAAAIPVGLIFLQPDLGTGLVFVPVVVAMFWVAGIRLKFLLVGLIAAMAIVPFAWHNLKDYQKERVMVFLNAERDPLGTGYTITQSKIAIGSGRMYGKGWLAGTQNRLDFLPERHTDFIFSVVGEEWGFVGSMGALALFWLLCSRGLQIAAASRELSAKLLAVGITTLLGFHVIINIAMVLGLAPVVGMPLPFVSYGGSAVITNLIAVGLLLSVQSRRTIF